MTDIKLVPLTPDDREQFITDNQEAFNYGALEEFGRRDDHFEEDGEIISRKTIEKAKNLPSTRQKKRASIIHLTTLYS